MALANLASWNRFASSACGSACGASDKPAVASGARGDFYDPDPQCWTDVI